MDCAMASILVSAARLSPPFFLMVRAKSSRCVHVTAGDLSLPNNIYTAADFLEPPSDAGDVPTVSAVKFMASLDGKLLAYACVASR